MTQESFSKIAPSIPVEPGVYRYFDTRGELIYVGKAKHLRKRISSYFTGKQHTQKTIELVKRIHHIEFTIVDDEEDAFLLENNLIKEYRPQYNIRLKDDKSYPYLVIKNERFPRVFFSHKKLKDGSRYFGPYTSIANVREMLAFIKPYFPLRTCKLNLSARNIDRQQFKVCLEYHLGNCKGPCAGLQTEESYQEGIDRLVAMLRGNVTPLLHHLRKQLQEQVQGLEFEHASITHQKIERLLNFKSKSTVVNGNTGTIDVFSLLEDGAICYVNYLSVNEGSITRTKTIELERSMGECREEVMAFAVHLLRNMFGSEALELVVPFEFPYAEKQVSLRIPKAGEKKKLLELSEKNVLMFKKTVDARKVAAEKESDSMDKSTVLESLKESLHLSAVPNHIECFDNSNLHGTDAVAAMVCFKYGLPSKKDYRHFNIRTVVGIDDFASMREVVFRRYKRLKESNDSLPNLVIIDGGKGQLNAALESIRSLGLENEMTLVGLAKQQEELFFSGDQESVRLDWNSEGLKLIRQIRDEVHRFGITHHRNKRSRSALHSELSEISGIGPTTQEQLIKRFRSVANIKKTGFAALQQEIGRHKAKLIWDYLNG